MKKNQKIIERLQAFIDSTDKGVKAFAESVGSHPNKFYVTLRGDTLPTLVTLMDIKAIYPHFSVDWLMTGQQDHHSATIDVPLLEIEKENEQLKKELKTLKELNGLLKLNLSSRLSEKEQELLNL